MSFFILITSILFVLPVQSRTRNRCPPPTSILPCTCELDHWVSCINVGSLDSIRTALTGKFPKPIYNLEITNGNVSSLPQHALGDIRVERLILTDINITDIHDEAFYGQDSLLLLELSNQHLTDIPTEALKVLPGLDRLNLKGNYITKIGVNSFDVESHIRFLLLSKNSISIIERGAFPRSLKRLNLANNHLSILNGSLLHMDSLQSLNAYNNKLNSITGEFRGLTVLDSLILKRNNLTSIERAFDDLISLTLLDLANNHLQDLEGLLPLKNLQHLNVADNQITRLGENTFSSLNSLERLDLSGNRISNVCQAIKPLLNLQHLILSNMGLTFLGDDCLKGMQGLVSLDLSRNSLTNITFLTGHSFPELIILSIKCNLLRKFKYGLKNLKSLIRLDISFNRFDYLQMHYFIHNSFLQILNIKGNGRVNPAQCGP